MTSFKVLFHLVILFYLLKVVDELNKTGNMDQITVVKSLKEKVVAVQQYHKQAEKTILDHDISRRVE